MYYYGVLEIEHIIPLALGGTDEISNLCLSCRRCNAFKSDRITAADPLTGEVVRLFDPALQVWTEHFAWEGALLRGITTCGRATVEALHINDIRLVIVRRHWMSAGWHPPEEE
jgi:hypothetical protein